MHYLQEKNLLTKFYHKFLANHQYDPTGYNTLKKILGERDMDLFKKKWEHNKDMLLKACKNQFEYSHHKKESEKMF